MCEQSEISYLDGEVVWVKLGSCWWPGEVVGEEKLPPDLLLSFRKPPIAVVKFYQEDTYEYVKNLNSIYKYNCSRKNEFINKGLYLYRTKHGPMEKFPEDVIRAEAAVGGDITILTRDEFQETKKESYADLFGDPAKKTPSSTKKGKGGRGRPLGSFKANTPTRKINVEKSNYKVHILLQGSKTSPPSTLSETTSTPSTSRAGSEPAEDNKVTVEQPVSLPSTPKMTSAGTYACHACSFTTTRLNVLILHNKTHSVTFMPYTPSPVRKKLTKTQKSGSKTPKPRKQRAEKTEKATKKNVTQKRKSEEAPVIEVKKVKTDEEIKSSLLADWDDMDDDSNDESSQMTLTASPEVAAPAESPTITTQAELPGAQGPAEVSSPIAKKSEDCVATEKPESSSDSKYEFCEDEPDWPVEADAGRKIPRVKNPSKRKEETKSLSLDDDDVAREVAELLNKTTVPTLPSAPEPLKVEENFPEPSIVKSPDKKSEDLLQVGNSPEKSTTTDAQPPKTIFKTKTFFRSRHSRSQDAIGKYVAEQLNAAERMDMSEEINGSEIIPPEPTVSPPIVEPVKVARLAPKIQLKKMKAEAAQMREQEKMLPDTLQEDFFTNTSSAVSFHVSVSMQEQEQEPVKNNEPMFEEVTQEKENINLDQAKEDTSQIIPDDVIDDSNILVNEKDNIKLDDLVESGNLATECSTYPEHNTLDTNNVFTSDLEEVINEEKNNVLEPMPDISYANENESNSGYVTTETCVEKENIGPIVEQDIPDIIDEQISKQDDAVETLPQETCMDEMVTDKTDSGTKDEVETLVSDDIITVITTEESGTESHTRQTELLLHSNQDLYSNSVEPYMNESTASAVDALLSVSREADRVTKIIGDDPPEDLFEDDNKDTESPNNLNGFVVNNDKEELICEKEKLNCGQEDLNGEKVELNCEKVELNYEKEQLECEKEELNCEKEELNSEKEELNCEKEELHCEKEEINCEKEEADKPATLDDVLSNNPDEASHHIETPINNNLIDNNIVIDNIPKESQESKIEFKLDNVLTSVLENTPSESDLQIAEALINLPATTIQNKVPIEDICIDQPQIVQETINLVVTVDVPQKEILKEQNAFITENVLENNKMETDIEEPSNQDNVDNSSNQLANADKSNARFETEQEKSENLNAAQSLVQMSESIEHKINISEISTVKKEKCKPITYKNMKEHERVISKNVPELKLPLLSNEIINDASVSKIIPFEAASPKLLKILEEPSQSKPSTTNIITKQIIGPGKEKILNFEVGKPLIGKPQSPKQKIIIRRSTPNKNLLNNINEVPAHDKIILSRSNKQPQDGSSVQTYTIQTAAEPPSDPNRIIIQQKVKKITKPPAKLQKTKPNTSLVQPMKGVKKMNDTQHSEDAIFDINSMPIVLSDDILTPESIEKMPIVMSDGNLLTNPPKLIRTKPVVEKKNDTEKISINAGPAKQELKTLIVNPAPEANKVTTPNILSKSSKLRGSKMLVFDKATKQKIVMTKQGPHQEPPVKEIKQQPTLIQHSAPQNASKPEKFILLPTPASPRQGRTQKIVIDPQTGKAHMLVGKGPDSPLSVGDSKPVSAKLIPSASDANTPGTVMIITNAQGTQSRIVLKPEHEKILFPNKQPNLSQLKAITQRATSNSGSSNKTLLTTVASVKTPTRIVPKQKSTIITSKGQLIVGGRVTTAQNIAPMPEIRPAPKRIIATEPRKIIQTIQKNAAEQLIYFPQKPGTMMLTAAQFEHLQRTGQIIQKTIPGVRENKLVVQKTINISSNETVAPNIQRQRIRRQIVDSPHPMKKIKQEIAIAPAPAPITAMPALCPISSTNPPALVPTNQPPIASSSTFSDLDNFEELLPSTAIARQPEPAVPPQPEPPIAAPPGLADGKLLAVPGEHFGGPTGSFYLCVEDNGTFTPIDNRPLILENNQLVPMPEPVPLLAQQPERRDILEAALANSDVFHGEPGRDEGPDFRDLNANVSVHCRVSETSSTLHQPIMTPVEVPTKADSEPTTVPTSLEDGLAVIGVTPHTVPTSLELPITVTDPRIAPKTTDPLSNNNYGAALLPSPSREMSFVSEEVSFPAVGPISMPLLTEEEAVGKSMPILTDDLADRGVSSVECGVRSPMSVDVREPELEEGGQWPRRLLTPGSDTSEASAEIPLQPNIQLSVSGLK